MINIKLTIQAILGITEAFKADSHPEKINLGTIQLRHQQKTTSDHSKVSARTVTTRASPTSCPQ
jgi:aspartate/tyrosine/aromatic aminotransferase